MKNTDINKFSREPKRPITDHTAAQSGTAVWNVTKKVLGISFKTILSLLLILFVTGIIVGITMVGYVLTLSDSKVNFDLNTYKYIETSHVYATNQAGEEVEVATLHGVENRKWVDLNQIPENLQNAVVAIEDKRFWEHNGVDWQRTTFAVANLFLKLRDEKQGGSTITQQLIKNISEENDVSIQRKLKEIFRALNLEKDYSKETILEAYLNVISLGCGAYGVQAAAETYFGKDVSELTLVECAALAGITKNPSQYNPLYNPKNNKTRRDEVLWNMLDQGLISQAEYDEAINTELTLKTTTSDTPSALKINDWYTDMVINDVIDDLVDQQGLSKSAATNLIYQGGLSIYSAVDMEMQDVCEEVYLNGQTMPADQKLQSSIFVMDYSGRVLATVGARGEKTANRLENLSTDTKRQPGSAIKPLSAYGPAIEYNILNWSTPVEDAPVSIVNGKQWPRNVYGYYRGFIPAAKALEISANACAANVVNQIGMERAFNFLHDKAHITSAYDKTTINGKEFSDINLSALATGGMTEGVTVKEMTAAYAMFGNGGKYYEPYSYYKVVDSDGTVLLDNTNVTYEQNLSVESANVMNKLLQNVVTGDEATASAARISGWQIFGKTGSTTNNVDRWFMGGNPYCVAGVWIGYRIPKTIPGYSNIAVPVWREVMAKYLQNKPVKVFDTTGIVQHQYCVESGGLATPNCPETYEDSRGKTVKNIRTGWYKKSDTLEPCELHDGTTSSDGAVSSEVVSSQEPASSKPEETVTSSPPSSTPQPSVSSSKPSGTSSKPGTVSSKPSVTSSKPSTTSKPASSKPSTANPQNEDAA